MDKNTIKKVFKEYLQPIEKKVLVQMAKCLDIDKYVKKLDTFTFLQLFIYAQLHQIDSLRDISFTLNNKKAIQKQLDLKSISAAQLSRKLRDIPPDIFQSVMHHLILKIHQTFGLKEGNKRLGKIHLIDSSTITLSLKLHPWAPKNKFTSGVKLHTRAVYEDGITYPDEVILTPARPSDRSQLDTLIVNEKGTIDVFDRGYFDFKKFDEFCAKGILFITRIKENTIVKVIEEVPVSSDSGITREAIVKLGKMKHPLRLIETYDSEGQKIEIIINDAKLSAEEISQLYRDRWQIELFFKWMKQHLVLKKCYGTSAHAVYNQIYIAMITYCLTVLMSKKMNAQGTLWNLHKYIREYWNRSFNVLKKEFFKRKKRTSSGRRKIDHEQIFKETLAQVEAGNAEHLEDLTYDPIF